MASWLSLFTGYDEENARRAEAADAQLKAMGLAQHDVLTDFDKFTVANQSESIQKTFDDEVSKNADSIVGAPLRFVGRVLGKTLWALPVWVWLAAGVAVFFWLGGGPVLQRWFKKATA